MKSRVTTKKGDQGMSRALDGELYPKSHPVMESVGAIDELRAQTACLRILVLREDVRDQERIAEFLTWLLQSYFPIGTECSDPTGKKPEMRMVRLGKGHIARIEKEQMRMEKKVDFAKAFIAGASNLASAQADLTCTAVRHVERSVCHLKEFVPVFEPDLLLQFINRLSDYFFVLARYLEDGDHMAVDYALLAEDEDK